MGRGLARLAVAALVAATAGLATLLAPSADAASCSGTSGVTVVVDHGALGGGVQSRCETDGHGAAGLFEGAGFDLTYVQRQPGFVCRVDDAPASDPCVNTPPEDAYWGLWWSDGTTGSWSYSALGVASLDVPSGGYVALAWQSGGGRREPGLAPRVHTAPTSSPSPTTAPTTAPTSSPSSAPTRSSSPTPTRTASPTPSAATTSTAPSPTASPTGAATHPSPSASPSKPATGDPRHHHRTTAPTATTNAGSRQHTKAPAESSDSRLPAWVAPVVLVVLLAVAAIVAVVRRRSGRP